MAAIQGVRRIAGIALVLVLAGTSAALAAQRNLKEGAAAPPQASVLPAPAPMDMQKHPFPPLHPAACEKIAASADQLRAERTTLTTQYFTPMFQPGPDGGLRQEDRASCLTVEGSCIVGNFLYNAGGPNGQRFDRNKVKFIFGQSTGANEFNRTNALIPCRTLAADKSIYPIGTAIYIPSFKGKMCPQNREPVDGCFIVGDVGSAIKGQGRFDIFTGECARYDSKRNVCLDPDNAGFNVPAKTEFRIIPKESERARALRSEVDAFIDNGWKPVAR